MKIKMKLKPVHGIIISVVIGLVFIGIGLIVGAVYQKYSTVMEGKVVESNCTPAICTSTHSNKKHTTTVVNTCYNCNIIVQDVNGNTATATLTKQRAPVQIGMHKKLMCTDAGECVAFVDAALIQNVMVGLGVAIAAVGCLVTWANWDKKTIGKMKMKLSSISLSPRNSYN